MHVRTPSTVVRKLMAINGSSTRQGRCWTIWTGHCGDRVAAEHTNGPELLEATGSWAGRGQPTEQLHFAHHRFRHLNMLGHLFRIKVTKVRLEKTDVLDPHSRRAALRCLKRSSLAIHAKYA